MGNTARSLVRWTATTLLAALCFGCSNLPTEPSGREGFASFGPRDLSTLLTNVKSIGLVITPEPETYQNLSRPLSPTARGLLDEFGGILGRGFYIARDLRKGDSGTRELTEALRPLSPQVVATLLERMEQNLIKRGYTVKYVPPPGRQGGGYDISGSVYQPMDALIEVLVDPGYKPDERQDYHFPFVNAAVNVYDGEGKQVAVRVVSYQGAVATDDPHQIPVPGKYALRNQKAVVENSALALEAFYDGAVRIADLAAREF
jgi:hypothetical protein